MAGAIEKVVTGISDFIKTLIALIVFLVVVFGASVAAMYFLKEDVDMELYSNAYNKIAACNKINEAECVLIAVPKPREDIYIGAVEASKALAEAQLEIARVRKEAQDMLDEQH